MLFWTRHASFRRVEMPFMTPSARIIKNPLKSTIFWTRRLNSATRPLNSATRQNAIMTPMAYYIGRGVFLQHYGNALTQCVGRDRLLMAECR